MKTKFACVLGLTMAAACVPDAELSPTSAAGPVQANVYLVAPTAPTCGPAKVTKLRNVLPNAKITGAMELDVQHLRRGKLFPDIERLIKAEAGDVVTAMEACGLPLASVRGVVVGFSDDGDIVAGIEATGVGSAGTLDCLSASIEKATGDAPWSRTTKGCTTTLELANKEGKALVVSNDMVVVSTSSLDKELANRVAGKGKSALDGRLAWARSQVDMTTTGWIASNVPSSAASGMGAAMAGLSRVGVSMDASSGLGLKVGAGFSTASAAKAAAAEMRSQVTQLKMMLPMLGLSSAVGDSIEVGTKGSVVKMGMFLSRSDLETMRTALESMSGGGGSSPPPPAPSPSRPGI